MRNCRSKFVANDFARSIVIGAESKVCVSRISFCGLGVLIHAQILTVLWYLGFKLSQHQTYRLLLYSVYVVSSVKHNYRAQQCEQGAKVEERKSQDKALAWIS